MARTRRADYVRSNRLTTLPVRDVAAAGRAALAVLDAGDAAARQAAGQRLLDLLAAGTGIKAPELVVPDAPQPHRRRGGRIVYSLQGEYRRRQPLPGHPSLARGGRPLGRIRVPHLTPARGSVVRPSAFLNTLLHEFCHHHDAEALGLLRSFHTAGFYARLRHLREQIARTSAEDPSLLEGLPSASLPAIDRSRASLRLSREPRQRTEEVP